MNYLGNGYYKRCVECDKVLLVGQGNLCSDCKEDMIASFTDLEEQLDRLLDEAERERLDYRAKELEDAKKDSEQA